MSETQRCRILSVYLRPWTLIPEQASLHVPHLLDLDVVLTPALAQLRRHSVKKARQVTLQRSMVDAWNDYCHSHIVSKHALRLIRNFTLTQMPDSVEADEEEDQLQAKTKLAQVSTPWATPDAIASWLDRALGAAGDVVSKHERAAATTRSATQRPQKQEH